MTSKARQDEFLSVLEAHKGIFYKIAAAYCRQQNNRDDLVQEMIIQLWKSFGRYNPRYRYSTWIYSIALNVAISFYRREDKRRKITLPVLEEIAVPEQTSGDTDQREQQLNQLQLFIAELPEIEKALMLLYLEEKSHQEMSEILGISVSNVSTRINRIKNKLRDKFSTITNN